MAGWIPFRNVDSQAPNGRMMTMQIKMENEDWEIITKEKLRERVREHLLFERTGGKEGTLLQFTKCHLKDAGSALGRRGGPVSC